MGNLWKMLKDATVKYGGVVIGGAVVIERYLSNKELQQNQEELKESTKANIEASPANKIWSQENLEASKSNLDGAKSNLNVFSELDDRIAMKIKTSSDKLESHSKAQITGDQNGNEELYLESYQKAKEKFQKASESYAENETNENKIKFLETHIEWKKAEKYLDEFIDRTKKSDVFDFIKVIYKKYVEFLDDLTPDKIVCVFNILLGSVTLSSFFSILSIMISENIINRIGIFNKYPRILKLIEIKTNLNKKISKFHLFMHFIFILLTLLGNIVMFFA